MLYLLSSRNTFPFYLLFGQPVSDFAFFKIFLRKLAGTVKTFANLLRVKFSEEICYISVDKSYEKSS